MIRRFGKAKFNPVCKSGSEVLNQLFACALKSSGGRSGVGNMRWRFFKGGKLHKEKVADTAYSVGSIWTKVEDTGSFWVASPTQSEW